MKFPEIKQLARFNGLLWLLMIGVGFYGLYEILVEHKTSPDGIVAFSYIGLSTLVFLSPRKSHLC